MDIETYTEGGVRKYDAVMIDNADAATRRITDQFATSPGPTGNETGTLTLEVLFLDRPNGGSSRASSRRRTAEAVDALSEPDARVSGQWPPTICQRQPAVVV